MILACPACAARYRVAEQEFAGVAGRTVRCANCGHLWYEAQSAQPPAPSDPDRPRDASASFEFSPSEPVVEAARPPAPRLEIPWRAQPTATRKTRRSTAVARVVLIVVSVLALTVAGMFLRRQFGALWPLAARLYASTRLSAAPSGAGLIIGKITPSRAANGLIVAGEIANPGNEARDVPRLRAALQDEAGKEMQSQTVDPPKPRLQPGEVAPFETTFAHPPDAATGVVVTFASP